MHSRINAESDERGSDNANGNLRGLRFPKVLAVAQPECDDTGANVTKESN